MKKTRVLPGVIVSTIQTSAREFETVTFVTDPTQRSGANVADVQRGTNGASMHRAAVEAAPLVANAG